jgi:hypothetical protein
VAWQSAAVTSAQPWEELLPVLKNLQPRSEAALNDWWQGAAPLLVEKMSALSGFPSAQVALADLSGHTTEIPPDRGAESNRMSIGGGGEGRLFSLPDASDWYITAVWVYGSRYGADEPPDMDFDIALSDGDDRMISLWKGRYASFKAGADAWTRVAVPATHLPPSFYVTLNFHATASNGVYVAYDAATKGGSIDSVPGKAKHAFPNGDWMIRVEMDHRK